MSTEEPAEFTPDLGKIMEHIDGRALEMSPDSLAPLVLIDGPSGAGKTTLASLIAGRWAQGELAVLRMDDLYPGWHGLAEGTHMLEQLLVERSLGREARWQRFDWHTGLRAEWHECSPHVPLLVEGCGSITETTTGLALASVWVDAPAQVRKRRALARDGEDYERHWLTWDRLYSHFVSEQRPAELATLIVSVSE